MVDLTFTSLADNPAYADYIHGRVEEICDEQRAAAWERARREASQKTCGWFGFPCPPPGTNGKRQFDGSEGCAIHAAWSPYSR